MHFSTTFALLLTSGLNTLAAPVGGLNPKGPWQITHLKTIDAAPGTTGVSSISFNFYDPSTKVRTKCQRTLPPGSGSGPFNDVYYGCDNQQVNYIYDGKSLGIQFSFHDPSVGQPDLVTEWGQNNVTTCCKQSYAGETCTFNKGVKLYITPDRAIAK